MRSFAHWLTSLSVHGLLGLFLWISTHDTAIKPQRATKPLAVEIESVNPKDRSSRGQSKTSVKNSLIKGGSLDLRPHWGGADQSITIAPSQPTIGTSDGTSEATRHDLLFTESKVFQIFDLLAEKIDRHLDYSDLLVEDGIQGTATLDLYFDQDGNVDEYKSKTYGSNRFVRGALIRAGRVGLVEWTLSDAIRLKKDQYRGQHFRADFEMSALLPAVARMERMTSNSYSFLRRKADKRQCLGGTPAGDPFVNLACVGMVAIGSLKKSYDQKYRTQVEALKDLLEEFDVRGLQGVGEAIRQMRS